MNADLEPMPPFQPDIAEAVALGNWMRQKQQRPQMWMDATLPRTHRVPVHPETGKVWAERAQQLCFLATCLLYEADQDPQWEIDYAALTAGVEFREEPLVMECHFMLGSAVQVKEPVPKVFKCHPDTWAGMTEEQRQCFDLKTAEERVFVMPEGTKPPLWASVKPKAEAMEELKTKNGGTENG